MGGATCGIGATYGRSGGGGGPRPQASKPSGGWGGGWLAAGGGDGGAEGRCAWADAVKARVARTTKAYAREVRATKVLATKVGVVAMGAPSRTVGTSMKNGHASLLAQLSNAPTPGRPAARVDRPLHRRRAASSGMTGGGHPRGSSPLRGRRATAPLVPIVASSQGGRRRRARAARASPLPFRSLGFSWSSVVFPLVCPLVCLGSFCSP